MQLTFEFAHGNIAITRSQTRRCSASFWYAGPMLAVRSATEQVLRCGNH
jgi:hypothetical protein